MGGGLGSPEAMKVDHPFLFAIVDKTGAVLFAENRADFSNITTDEKLHIAHALQKAFVGVDEFGTEAAAVTTYMGGGLGSPEAMKVDHPFLFAIVDKTGAVLFAGQVMDPR